MCCILGDYHCWLKLVCMLIEWQILGIAIILLESNLLICSKEMLGLIFTYCLIQIETILVIVTLLEGMQGSIRLVVTMCTCLIQIPCY